MPFPSSGRVIYARLPRTCAAAPPCLRATIPSMNGGFVATFIAAILSVFGVHAASQTAAVASTQTQPATTTQQQAVTLFPTATTATATRTVIVQ